MKIRKDFRFEAAHVLPYHQGKCARLHGHSYRLEVVVEGPLIEDGPSQGMVIDFGDVSAAVSPVVGRLDHFFLNDILDNPTCERVVLWIADLLAGDLLSLHSLTLWETATSCAIWEFNEI
jgi:6-pyruvoyltetrahydropterin/6-carboxytetrahydropterin synthase